MKSNSKQIDSLERIYRGPKQRNLSLSNSISLIKHPSITNLPAIRSKAVSPISETTPKY